ncbi:MAG: coproporphyrinogen III oxidase, partial [Comamonadaceae bacterium]|nr:coproporphyrinogen III oxidase [Comamonadaceae bacterium]
MSQAFNTESTVARVRGYLLDLQARIIGALEAAEGARGARAARA